MRPDLTFRQSFTIFFLVLTFLLIVGSCFALIITIVEWLDSGKWMPTETQLLLENYHVFRSWFNAPKSWLGAHQLFSVVLKTPWSFALPTVSLLIALLLEDSDALRMRAEAEKLKNTN